ncbi:MAG: tetratricopeptide repeat protein [Phycisphaerae bacterium]|nr:tetratricopeptide repeat protein [Phycisphaerae bacterium]
MASEKNEQRPPVVFISYSHDTPEHADRVLTLSNRLRQDGIDCILDQYEESRPEGWPRWMDKHIRNADFVLMICTEVYYKRVMDEEKPGTGQGVRWEGNLIYQHIYDADTKNAKFLPVLFADGQASHIPTPLKGTARYFVDRADGYDLLYRHLTNQPRARKPDLRDLKKLPSVEYRKRKLVLWPGVSLPRGGPKVSVPFAGREEELKELATGMSGDRKVVAVVGMAGQGKSCLVGEWYKRGAKPSQGVGLLWRKVYEAGYTFDRFIDELHLYLAGEPIDRMQVKTVRDRATIVENLLAAQPCWIVLDGVERWLKRWAADPDADAKDPTPDDRAGYDPVLDEFLKDACFWENGSRLLLTTHAVPSAFDENPPAMIGHRHGHEKRLTDLKPEEAIGLLDELDVKGTEKAKREAVSAYDCHAFAVHVLGVLIRDLYGGDVSRWRQVNPLQDKPELGGLFARIIDTCKEDLPLLEFVACSLGPAPVAMLAELVARDETSIRKSLAGLKKWQMVEFKGSGAEQHTLVRKFLTERMGQDEARAHQKRIAAWWTQRKTPTNPTEIEEVRSLLRAVEHLVAACDPDAAAAVFLAKPWPETGYCVGEWLWVFGYLDEGIRIEGLFIKAYMNLIDAEGRIELRNELARHYNNRGLALTDQGHLSEAIADYTQAIEVRDELVEREDRRELRNGLAMCYNNRGNALQDQGHLAQAIADFGHAIEITQGLVEREGRRELRNDLAMCYNNRGNALQDQGHLAQAIADYGHAIEIYEGLVEREGRRELRNNLARCYNNRGTALRVQGHLPEAIADHGRAIEIQEELVGREGHHEQRNDLAICYNNRGNALRVQGHLAETIADYSHAIEITQGLVEQEGRRELRNDLARCYNNRGAALRVQGHLTEAISDYGHAIEIREGLVEREGRRELRSDLESSLFNRALARSRTGEWQQAGADVEKGAALLRALVEEGQRHILRSLLQTLGFQCRYAKELDAPAKAVAGANEMMRWFLEEVEQDRTTEPLLKEAAGFAERVRGNQELLLGHGLDEALWRRFQSSLGPPAGASDDAKS